MGIDFYMPAYVVSGEDCVKKGGEIFKSFGESCLIVTGGRSARLSGALRQVTKVLSAQGISFTVFSEITQNPTISSCRTGGQAAREQAADFIIGIGGGSPLDAAKAVGIYAANPNFSASDIYKRTIPAKALPVILVGTTAGTGSEVTGVSVLTDDSVGMKRSISGADCYARVSFLNPRFTDSMPLSVTVSTALDAFAHAAEGWFSPKRSEISDAYALLALPKIYRALKEIFASNKLPDIKTRDELFYASIYAGLALNITGAAFPHTLGYVLTEDFDVPHGKACAVFMPVLTQRAAKFSPDRLCELLSVLETDEKELLRVICGLVNLDIKMTDSQIKEYCERWNSDNKNFLNTPGGFSLKDAAFALGSLSKA